MTIRDLGYRGAAFERVPGWRRWLPLASKEFGHLFRSKWGVAVFCVCVLPFVVKLFVLMVWFGVVDFGGMRAGMAARAEAFRQWDPTQPDFYVEAVVRTFPGLPLFVLLTSTVTAGAVARDRMTNGLELLWTRGITPVGYLAAKILGALALISLVTVGVPLLLWVFAVLMADDWQLFVDTFGFMPGLVGGLVVVTSCWATISVLVSSLAATPSQSIVTWCILMVGSSAVANVMAVVFDSPAMRSWASLWDAGGVVARAAAGMSTRGAPLVPAMLVLFSVVAALGLAARRRFSVREALG